MATPRQPPASARLRIAVEPGDLRHDLRSLTSDSWIPQRAYSSGSVTAPMKDGWTAIPLRSQGGSVTRTDPGGPGMHGFRETEFLGRLPAFADLLSRLPCEMRSARLLALHPGTVVPRHRDDYLGFSYGQLRLHIPILTNPRATLTFDDVTTVWEPGAVWYGDFSMPHSVTNRGDSVRVHLVVDCLLSEGLLAVFPEEFTAAMDPGSLLFNPPQGGGGLPEVGHSVMLPRSLVDDLLAEARFDEQPEAVAFSVSGGSLVLRHNARPLCRLERVMTGEWRMCGWTAERTFRFGGGDVTLCFRHGSNVREMRLPWI
jgi:aspartate beta-hydroxylase